MIQHGGYLGGLGFGVILLFLYVLPRRQRTGGTLVGFIGRPNEELIKLERRWDRLSAIGLWSVIIGIVPVSWLAKRP